MTPRRLANERVALYRRVLGEAWDSLPAPLQAMHDVESERTADGVAVIERGSGLLARLVAFVIGLPPAGANIPVTVSFRARQGREHWQRNFAGPLVLERAGARPWVPRTARLRTVRSTQCQHGAGVRKRTHAARRAPLERVRVSDAAGAGTARKLVRIRGGRAFPFSRGDRPSLHRIDPPLSRLARPARVTSVGGRGLRAGDGPHQLMVPAFTRTLARSGRMRHNRRKRYVRTNATREEIHAPHPARDDSLLRDNARAYG